MNWRRDCAENHAKCNKKYTALRYPTRLSDVGALGEATQVRLCLTVDYMPIEPYVALSHCWGNPQHVPRLTTQNEDVLRAGFDVASLPKTYVDAICVARRLRVRWLWIDSLCIIQDSADDWRHEAGSMGQIYQNSILTIAALDGADCTRGCFFDRNPSLVECPRIRAQWSPTLTFAEPYLLVNCDVWNRVCKAPLARRAWCFQERLLSTRMLYFARKQIYWECLAQTACESLPIGLPEILLDELNQLEVVKHVVPWPDHGNPSITSLRLPNFPSLVHRRNSQDNIHTDFGRK